MYTESPTAFCTTFTWWTSCRSKRTCTTLDVGSPMPKLASTCGAEWLLMAPLPLLTPPCANRSMTSTFGLRSSSGVSTSDHVLEKLSVSVY